MTSEIASRLWIASLLVVAACDGEREPDDGGLVLVDAALPDAGLVTDGAIDASIDDCEDPPIGTSRPHAAECARCRPRSAREIGGGECTRDGDCTDGINGRCVEDRRRDGVCSYDECFADADCGPGRVCACDGGRGGANVCVPSDCASDADCGSDGLCAPAPTTCGPVDTTVTAYRCRTPIDSCVEHRDCGPLAYCGYVEEAMRWACITPSCT